MGKEQESFRTVIWSFDVTPPASTVAIMKIAIKATNMANRDCDSAILLKIGTMMSIVTSGIVRCGVWNDCSFMSLRVTSLSADCTGIFQVIAFGS